MEFSANPTVSDLTRELQVLVPRWRQSEVYDRARPSRFPDRPHRSPLASVPSPNTTTPVTDLPRLPVSSSARSGRPPGRPPLSSTYDRSKIDMRPHPLSNVITRCYTKPDGKVIFLSRNCSHCREAHFDFEHDTVAAASAHFGFDESGYEQWDWDSDTVDEDTSAKKLN